MAFKLRSGNKSSFKQLGSKENTEQYNARIKAEYEAKLKAHGDSTRAYNQALIIDDLYKQSADITTENYKDVKTKAEESGIYPEQVIAGRRSMSDKVEFFEKMRQAFKPRKKARTLEKELKEGEIYPTERRKFRFTSGDDILSIGPTAGQIKPGDKPREPVEMIGIDIKNIDMGQVDTETPDLPKRSKYMISEDKKWRFNLDTGEWTKRKKPQKRKEQKPRRRKTRNLVTGKWNITKRKTGTTQ